MSILKSSPQAVAIFTHGFRQAKTLSRKTTQKTSSLFEHGNYNRVNQARQLQSTTRDQSGYLSDPKNIGRRQSGVNFDTLGSWNNRLELDVNLEQSIAAGSLIPKISTETVATATALGRREHNEDRVCVKEITPDLLLFAIYDGHGGSTAVDYVCKHMPEQIRFWADRGDRDLGQILKMCFKDVHESFVRHLLQNYIGNDQAVGSGCTATVCLLYRGVQLVVGHVGDSQAVLCRNGRQMTLTTAHKPEKAEKERIEKCGGFVTYDSLGNPRVNGRLEMSRSLGDVELTNYGVIADPQVQAVQLKHGSDAFLILTTDGVHYVLSEQELVDIACTCKDPQEAASFITDQALHYGSEDNCTALIVPFGAWGKYAEKKNIQFRFSRIKSGSRYN